MATGSHNNLEYDSFRFGKKWVHYHYHCTDHPLVLQCWCGGCWRETGTGHQQRHWAGTWYTGAGVVRWSLPSYGTQYSVLREGAYISTFTLKNLFLRTRYLFSGTFSEYWVGVNMVTLTNSGFSFWRHCFLLGMPELVTSCSSGQSLPPDTRLVQSVKILLQAPTLSLSPHPRSRPSPPGHWCWG